MSEQEQGSVKINQGSSKSVTTASADAMPETIELNGVTYRREADWVEKEANRILNFKTIARLAGVRLEQAVWFVYRDGQMPA